MSTATYAAPLRAVPTPPTKERFAFLLAVRRRAQRALDAALALPRGAAGWALRHLRALLDGATDRRVLAWAGARLTDTLRLVRGIGLVPLAASVLSTPPVWRAAVRLAGAAGSALAALGRGAWTRISSLLHRGGSTGARIAHALSSAGTALAGAAGAAAARTAAQPVIDTVECLGGLVRPVSHSVVTHRLLSLLVPTMWLRIAVELIALPLLLVPALPGRVRPDAAGTPPLAPVAPVHPTPAENPSAPAHQPAADGHGTPLADPAPDDEPLNRAERRAHQQDQARTRRAQTRH
ncbi:hypothetical protein [Pedococcus sp. 5OH_020]|uniref:hypothetical protein n=1 Tax=Pedococcus sp. 5OH_020 TaxID=2989814 RepID=UPI0022EA0A2F|nr:hypothetical protein [Pedococcus sp. 5OH_020]